jgi:AcrR family transcriptional regulator
MTPVTPPLDERAASADGAAASDARGVASRRRDGRDEVEQALLAAAARLLAEEGPEALSVRRVAAEAGVSAMGVYSRFGGKQGLVEALFLDGFVRLQQVLATVPRGDDPVEELLEGSRRYRRFALESPAVYAIMFSRAIPEFVPSAPCKLDAAGAFGVLVDAVRRGIDSGALRPSDPVDIAEGIWATCHGLVSLELAGMGFVPDREAHFEATNAALLRGLRASPSA